REVIGDVLLQIGPQRRIRDRQKVQHELSHLTCGSEILGADVGFDGIKTNIVGTARSGASGLGKLAQIEPLPEEVMEQAHAVGVRILERDCEDAARSQPAYQLPKRRLPLCSRDVVEDVRTEDEIRA